MEDQNYIKTGCPEFDDLYPMVKAFLEQDVLDVVIDGKKIRGYRSPDTRSIWIRDYSDMLQVLRYFEEDIQSVIEHFAETQGENGRIFDYFTTFPEKLPCERENWTKYVRVPVEADVEFRFVKAAFLAWQATGDNEWIKRLLPRLEKALGYVLSHPWRWDKKTGLVKRAYTIDTWDFAYTAGAHDWLQFQIDDRTYWGIMHGDNSGYYEAFRLLARIYSYFGEKKRAEEWAERAQKLKQALNEVCWNGRFYTHFVKITPVTIPGVDETQQLSLSNPMDINRRTATQEMAERILQEYLSRRDTSQAFAEWFSIDPPFPDGIFGDEKLIKGAYVNGGIMPLVGGELARAAFEHGFEEYGVDILKRYAAMIAEKGESYLWYFPDGRPSTRESSTSPEASPTDGWGSSAMLYALIEGLAGIQDQSTLFKKVKLSPRWSAAGIKCAEVQVRYAASGTFFGYSYVLKPDSFALGVRTKNSSADFHVLLPEGREVNSVMMSGQRLKYNQTKIRQSRYVDFSAQVKGVGFAFIRLQ